MKTYNNPIIPGFYPDPSICRVGEEYYLVNSSFHYFPGVPIFHSRDLVHWEQIGNVLDRVSQVDLREIRCSGGIYAPTIRYHKGLFYMITTNVDGCDNFFVTANSPEGPWSEPIIIGGEGIDPSLFFDEDKVYYVGQRQKRNARFFGDCEIWVQELDVTTGKLLGEAKAIWDGAMKAGVWQEGPHLYKKGDYYYIMIAEGGTSMSHSVMIARSKSLLGPYEANPNNPILTHRHLGKHYPITCVGHGDLIEAHDGSWWMVHLGCRPTDGKYSNLGRETFLTNVSWEDDWPVVNPGVGKTEFEMPAPHFIEEKESKVDVYENFEEDTLGYEWLTLRTTEEERYDLQRKRGTLSLKLRPDTIYDLEAPSVVLRRQQHKHFKMSVELAFRPTHEQETAGLVLMQNNDFNICYERKMRDGEQVLTVTKRTAGKDEVVAMCEYEDQKIYLEVEAHDEELTFRYGSNEEEKVTLIEKIEATLLSTEVAGGFVGTCIGMYASSNHTSSSAYAEFTKFRYIAL